ncbi:hypothetical protein GLYMA_04G178566v4 [Glycine max]|nr:hypothetical protein GLYMA_04G178566v4 [Glycine max]KAH1111886.1 hypothetical protein GYH30_010301 [Glycine max]
MGQEGWNALYHTIYNCTDGAYVIEAYQLQDVDGMTLLSPRFLDLVEDLDTL